jgi:hypothetical protein
MLYNKATVTSVFQKFCRDLTKVTTEQQAEADAASEAQDKLKSKMSVQRERQLNAEDEVAQASLAIKNIGELFWS